MVRSPSISSPPVSFSDGNTAFGQLEVSAPAAAGLMRPPSFLMIPTRVDYGQAIVGERYSHIQKWREHCHAVDMVVIHMSLQQQVSGGYHREDQSQTGQGFNGKNASYWGLP